MNNGKETREIKTFPKYLREYCENTSIHGVHYLAEKRSLCERYV